VHALGPVVYVLGVLAHVPVLASVVPVPALAPVLVPVVPVPVLAPVYDALAPVIQRECWPCTPFSSAVLSEEPWICPAANYSVAWVARQGFHFYWL
jgi:hypothetical protein